MSAGLEDMVADYYVSAEQWDTRFAKRLSRPILLVVKGRGALPAGPA
jgi:hypothetical protein